jgi:hypothetical protein
MPSATSAEASATPEASRSKRSCADCRRRSCIDFKNQIIQTAKEAKTSRTSTTSTTPDA